MSADKDIAIVSHLRKSAFICGLLLTLATPSFASGVWGDATLATREKGKIVTEALVNSIVSGIEQLRGAALPAK